MVKKLFASALAALAAGCVPLANDLGLIPAPGPDAAAMHRREVDAHIAERERIKQLNSPEAVAARAAESRADLRAYNRWAAAHPREARAQWRRALYRQHVREAVERARRARAYCGPCGYGHGYPTVRPHYGYGY